MVAGCWASLLLHRMPLLVTVRRPSSSCTSSFSVTQNQNAVQPKQTENLCAAASYIAGHYNKEVGKKDNTDT